MHSNDFTMIQALISQAPLEQLQDVKALVEGEIEHAKRPGLKAGVGPAQGSIRKIPDSPDTRHAVPQDLHVSESGATSSHVPLRYDLIPRSLLERAAERYTMGAKVHGDRNYQQGLADYGNIIVRINHIYEHLNKLFHPDYRKADSPQDEEGIDIKSINDNLGAILWGVGFICEVAEHERGKQILIELRYQGRIKTNSD